MTGRFPERRAEPTFLADEMSAPADFQVNDAVSEERTSGRSDALSVRKVEYTLVGKVTDGAIYFLEDLCNVRIGGHDDGEGRVVP